MWYLLWSLYYFYLCQIVFKSRKFVKYDQRIVLFFPPTWQPTEVLKSKGLELSGCCARGLGRKRTSFNLIVGFKTCRSFIVNLLLCSLCRTITALLLGNPIEGYSSLAIGTGGILICTPYKSVITLWVDLDYCETVDARTYKVAFRTLLEQGYTF